MFRRIRGLFVTALMAVFLVSGCAAKPKGRVVLARFDGSSITEDDFNKKVQNLPKELQSVVKRRKKDFLEDMINEHFLVKEARARGIMNQPDVKELIEAARRKIMVAKLIETEVDKKIKLDSEEVTHFYENHKEEFMTPLLLRASHILVKTEDEAKQVKTLLDEGKDFAELARTHSTDSTAVRGGDLGFFQKGQLIAEFEEVAFRMKKGDTSPVFKTQFGFHIMLLTDRAEPAVRDFKSVMHLVEKQLVNEKRSKLYKEYIQKLKGNTKIEIDEKKLEV